MANPRKRFLPLGIGKAIDSIKKLDNRGLLYYMDYKANYYKLEKYAMMLANSTPGCSTFFTETNENEAIFGRNYDFNHYRYNIKGEKEDITSLIIVVKTINPKAKYKTLGISDGFWLDFEKGRYFENSPSDNKTDMTKLAMAPFIIMDGINEKGLATSIMHLPTENEWIQVEYRDVETLSKEEKQIAIIYNEAGKKPEKYDYSVKNNALAINTIDKLCWKANKNFAVNQNEEGKKAILHPILMRKMLDYCQNVDEAIEMAKSYNVKSPLPDNDYHIMIADKSKKAVILEWIDNKLNVKEIKHGTNFYITGKKHYGYGQDRDEIIENKLKRMSELEAMDLLEEVSQNPFKNKYLGFTEWSAVYNLEKDSLLLSIFLDYEKKYNFNI